MRFVVDSSVALKWVVAERGSDLAATLLSQELYAPDFIYLECANALWKLAQRGEATAEQTAFKLRALRQVKIGTVVLDGLASRALDIACGLQHPVYDCLYLAVAEAHDTHMVTADARLLRRLAGTAFAHLAISLEAAAAN